MKIKVKTNSKNKDDKFRLKNGETTVGTLEKNYGMDFGVRADMKLTTYLKKNGFGALSKLIENK